MLVASMTMPRKSRIAPVINTKVVAHGDGEGVLGLGTVEGDDGDAVTLELDPDHNWLR